MKERPSNPVDLSMIVWMSSEGIAKQHWHPHISCRGAISKLSVLYMRGFFLEAMSRVLQRGQKYKMVQ